MSKKYSIHKSRQYLKSLQRVSQWQSFSWKELEQVINMLAEGKPMPTGYRDHQLDGKLSGYRECHIRGDLLLVYEKIDNVLIIHLINIGSHSSLNL